MKRKHSIVSKTFLFCSLLIVLVVCLTLTILYFAMPAYYLHKKDLILQTNLDSLTASIRNVTDPQECADLIAAFVEENNTEVLSFTADDQLIVAYSSPFVSMGGEVDKDLHIAVTPDAEDQAATSFYSFAVEGEEQTVVVNEGNGQDGASGKKGVNVAIILQGNEDYKSEQQLYFQWGSNDSAETITLDAPVGGTLVDHVQVSGTLQPIDEAKSVILSLIPYLLLVNIALGLALAYLYARQLTKPILRISDATVRMQNREPDALSGVDSDDELGQLSRGLDALYTSLRENIETLHDEMDKVSRLERAKTELMQSASHELKTPIAALNGIVEGMIDNVGVYKDKDTYLRECKGLIDRLSGLVGEILSASKAETESAATLTDVDIAVLIEQVLAAHGVLIQERSLHVIADVESITIQSDESLLRRVLSNLISNAVRYTAQDGEIRVTLEARDDGHCLTVENECDPIPDEELAKLFEPFYTRSYSRDRAKSGTGLGLYIVQRSLEQLGIPYKLESTALGLRMSLFL